MFTTIMYPSTNKIRTRRIPWSNTLSSHILFFPLRHLKCSLAHCKDIQPVCSKEISLGCSLEGLMLKLKLQYFGHLMRRLDSLEKTDAGRDWGQEEKGMTEDEMAGWHHWLDGRESEWTPGVVDGQGGLACCDSWGHKESDTTERLNWTGLNLEANNSHRVSSMAQWQLKLIQSPLNFWTEEVGERTQVNQRCQGMRGEIPERKELEKNNLKFCVSTQPISG